jgi:hypothetical protein
MEEILIWTGLYICFALIALGAYLAFPAEPKVAHRHWAGVLPGDTVEVHGESRKVVEIDFATIPCIWIGPSTSRHNQVIGWS